MDKAVRKTLWILVGILIAEAVPFFLTIAWSRPGAVERLYGLNGWWGAWLAAIAVTAAYTGFSIRAFPLIGQRFFDLHWLKLFAIPFALVTGTMEELWFRKLLMDWAAGAGASDVVQILASAAVFGLAHGVWGLFARQWRVAVGATLATAVLGGLLAIVYLLASRNVAPCIWAHGLINLAIEPWLILAAVTAGSDRRRG
jgi:hypothetical protein